MLVHVNSENIKKYFEKLGSVDCELLAKIFKNKMENTLQNC